MQAKVNDQLYQLLIDKKFVEKKVLDTIIKDHPLADGSVWIDELLKDKLIDYQKVLDELAKKLGIQFRSLASEVIDEAVIKKVPVKVASHYKFVPLSVDQNLLTIGVYYPLDIKMQDEIRFQLGYDIEQILATKDDILELLRSNYGFGASTIEEMFIKGGGKKVIAKTEKIEDIDKAAHEATVSDLVNQIILDAYKKRATDIHIEPYRGEVRFRYRIDGILYDAKLSTEIKHFIAPILSRIKIMSNLDIVEHRLPQDGQSVVQTKYQRVDLRVSFIPALHGESVVIRILPQKVLYDIEQLGFEKKDKDILSDMIKKANGIIFVTGPTGSGKSTTLYACLNKLNTKDKKIITIEDPVEYELSGITQIQVNNAVGLSFAAGLRSVLRHDPDIMMVGEVRDKETAEIAVRVALTGHLVLSTLHTNSAAASIHRLMDIGIEPYLIQSSTNAFIAQRLLRVLCTKCRKEIKNPEQEIVDLVSLNLSEDKPVTLYKKEGCKICNNTGFHGRTAIYEILPVDNDIKELIQRRASSKEIEEMAIKKGMKPIVQCAMGKVADGTTTIDEVMNALSLVSAKHAQVVIAKEKKPLEENIQVHKEKKIEQKIFQEDEKRTYRRLNAHFPMTFSIHRNLADDIQQKLKEFGITEEDYWKEHTAITEDISAGGIHFKSPLYLIEGTVIDIKILVPVGDGVPKEINCLAKVKRVKEIGKTNVYGISECFLDMSTTDRNVLNEFIERNPKGFK